MSILNLPCSSSRLQPSSPLLSSDSSSFPMPSSPDSLSMSGTTLCNSSLRTGFSPGKMDTDLCASPPSPSPVPHNPPDDMGSLFLSPGSSPLPACIGRHESMHNKSPRKYHPYLPSPTPLELRYSARFMGQGGQPEFSLEAIQKVCYF